VLEFSAPKKSEGAGKAGCWLAPAIWCAISAEKNAHEHTGISRGIRPSLRNGLTAYGALSPETNSFCLRHRRIDGFARPGWACENLRRFDTSHGCQNHTLLPYANCAARPARIIAHSPKTKLETALQCLARASALASTATRTPRIVTTRTPLFDEAGWRVKETDLRKMRSRIFSPRNLDDPNRVELAGEIRVLAQRVLVYFRTLDRGSKCSLTCPVGRSVLASTQAKPIAGG
jgi:hypothetical protein